MRRIKYGNDVRMLRTFKLDSPHEKEADGEGTPGKTASTDEPASADKSASGVKEPVAVEEEPFIPYNPWAGKAVYERFSQNESGINEVWFPPSPQKDGNSQSSTRAP